MFTALLIFAKKQDNCFEKYGTMKKIIAGILIFTAFVSCNTKIKNTETMNDLTKQESKASGPNDTVPKVTGIGGIFFFSDDPSKTREWYATNLGMEVNEWGSSFEFRNANRPEEINYLQWSPFKNGSEYFAPSKKEFMINYRVQNIEGLVRNLKQNGVTVLDSIEEFEYGKFVHLIDPEGNKIELWEPVDSILTKIGSETTK